MEKDKLKHEKQCAIHDVSVSLLAEFADYILNNANWSESYADKPWYSEKLKINLHSKELAELFLNSH